MNNGIITLEVEGASEITVTNLNCSQITLVNSRISGPSLVSYQLTGCENQRVTMVSLEFDLIQTDLNALKSYEHLASGSSDSFIIISAGNGIVDSISNTELMAIPLDMAVQASPYIPDMTSPVIEGFDINFNSRFSELTLYFSEPILLESLNFVSVTIEIATLNLTYTLTGGAVAGTSFRPNKTVTMFLNFDDISMIKRFKALATDDNIALSTFQ